MKTAILTDTNCGMSEKDAAGHGIFLLGMPVIIDGRQYTEHKDIDDNLFYTKLVAGADITTSQPSAGEVTSQWKALLKEYDEIVVIPMSSGLSGTCQSAMLYAEDFGGRVHVVNNQRISVTQRQSVLEAKALADNGAEGAEIKAILEKTRYESHIYIMVDTLEYLKKGGRITPAAAMVASVLNIKPVLQIQGDKLDAFAKVRGIKQAKKVMIKAVEDGIVREFGGIRPEAPNAWIGLAHTQNFEMAEEFRTEVMAHFPNYDVHVDQLPISIATHIGPGALALTCTKVLPGGCAYK